MRVALVSPYDLDVPGGVQAHVLELAQALRAGGDRVVVVGPGGGELDGVRTVGGSVRVPFNASVAPIALAPPVARRTVEILRDVAPDVVHVHEPAVPWVSLVATLRAPAPVVATFHAWSDAQGAYRAARPVLRRALAGVTALLAVSPAAATYHARALGLSEGRFRVVPNGVTVARFADASPMPELRGDGSPTVLFVGRLEQRKGLETLVRAFVRLKARRPTVRLLVVGDGPERDRCQRLLPARLRADAIFLGRVDADELPRVFRTADVFVAPALGGESFGIVLLEAMAAGRPVVASDIPGYRTLLRDGVNGRLSPPGDAAALADTIDTLLANPALREAMAGQARATAAAHDWSVVADRMRGIYAEATRAAGEVER